MFFGEKYFESRLYFVDRLIDMGARIVQRDPHRVVVIGPARLRASCRWPVRISALGWLC